MAPCRALQGLAGAPKASQIARNPQKPLRSISNDHPEERWGGSGGPPESRFFTDFGALGRLKIAKYPATWGAQGGEGKKVPKLTPEPTGARLVYQIHRTGAFWGQSGNLEIFKFFGRAARAPRAPQQAVGRTRAS